MQRLRCTVKNISRAGVCLQVLIVDAITQNVIKSPARPAEIINILFQDKRFSEEASRRVNEYLLLFDSIIDFP